MFHVLLSSMVSACTEVFDLHHKEMSAGIQPQLDTFVLHLVGGQSQSLEAIRVLLRVAGMCLEKINTVKGSKRN